MKKPAKNHSYTNFTTTPNPDQNIKLLPNAQNFGDQRSPRAVIYLI